MCGMAFSQCGARKMAKEYSQDESRVILQNDFIQLKFYHLFWAITFFLQYLAIQYTR